MSRLVIPLIVLCATSAISLFGEMLVPVRSMIPPPATLYGGVPLVRNGYLVDSDLRTARVSALKLTGTDQAQESALRLAGIDRLLIKAVAARSDGSLAVTASAYGEGRGASVLIWLSAKGSIDRIVRTTPFAPMEIAFDDAGTLWAAGRVHDEIFNELPEYDVLRSYDADGKLGLSALPRTSFQTKRQPATLSFLNFVNGRLYFYTPATRELVELENGVEVKRRTIEAPSGAQWSGFAPVAGGSIYFTANGSQRLGLPGFMYVLRPSATRPEPVAVSAEPLRGETGILVGSDQGQIVLLSDQKLFWFPAD